jgi:hypothetical protein
MRRALDFENLFWVSYPQVTKCTLGISGKAAVFICYSGHIDILSLCGNNRWYKVYKLGAILIWEYKHRNTKIFAYKQLLLAHGTVMSAL